MSVLRASSASRAAGLLLAFGCLVAASASFAVPLYQAPFLIAEPDLSLGNPAVGDLDNDGVLDIVISGSVLHGNGDGTLDQVQAIAYRDGANGPTSTALGDVDNDGWLDLAVIDPASTRIFLNNGDGTLGPELSVAGGRNLALGDVNGDGNLDLITALSSGVNTRLGIGDGTFSQFSTTLPTPSGGPWGIAVADLNGDGRLDVLASSDGWLAVFRGNGNNTFQPRLDYATAAGAFFVTSGRVNDDAHVDVVTAGSYDHTVRIHLGNGTGILGPTVTVNVGPEPSAAVVADFDLDGHADLAVATGGGMVPGPDKLLEFLPGNGDATFGTHGVFDIQYPGNGYGQIAAAHMNSDAHLDVVIDNAVLLGNGDGTFGTYRRHATGASPSDLALVDLNHDSRPDVVTPNSGASTISVLLGAGDGSFGLKTDFGTTSSPRRIAVADVNGDTHPDVLATRSGNLSALLGTGTGAFAAPVASAVGASPWPLAIGDVNADGNLDVVTGTQGTGGSESFRVMLGNGSGTFTLYRTYGTPYLAPFDVALGDMNNDGKLDIVGAMMNSFSGSDVKVTMLLGNGDGTFGAVQQFSVFYVRAVGAGKVLALRLIDLDQDGKRDVVVSGDAVEWLRGDGAGSLDVIGQTVLHSNGSNLGYTDLDIADFDGDGYTDVASLGVSCVAVLFGNGTGAFPRKRAFGVGATPMALRAALLDANPTPDLVTAHIASSHVKVLLDASSLVVSVPGGPSRSSLSLLAHPNPARSRILLQLGAPPLARVSVRIHDLGGRLVRSLAEEASMSGRRTVSWDLADRAGRRVPAGIYLCVASDGVNQARSRLVVLK